MKEKNINKAVSDLLARFLKMRVGGKVIRCPYWMNKLADGRVKIRGFLDGKGSAQEIERELNRVITNEDITPLSPLKLRKLAKRSRIGIDCSGLVYQVLAQLYRTFSPKNDLDEIFLGGINKTNAATLTSKAFCNEVKGLTGVKMGDLIRMMGGKHILVIVKKTKTYLTYVHSSERKTKINGVHLGRIRIIDTSAGLDKQTWLEKSREREDFGKKYFDISKGDGIFRLKIFQNDSN